MKELTIPQGRIRYREEGSGGGECSGDHRLSLARLGRAVYFRRKALMRSAYADSSSA